MKYKVMIFDLDNTLVFTNKLNNESYNHSLRKNGYKQIKTSARIRITREIVASLRVSEPKLLKKIIQDKQKYFRINLNKIVLNRKLYDIIISSEKKSIFIWTSSERKRATAILNYFNLKKKVNRVIFSDKNDFSELFSNSINNFKEEINKIIVYEDNIDVVRKLKKLKIKTVFIKKKL
jgi:beta-phosphoglucomutase-like phosphatase (HAD superfamily)